MTRTRSSSVGTLHDSLNSLSICGRFGCHLAVQNGMQCHECLKWYHFKCTGLNESQICVLTTSTADLLCMSCTFDQNQTRHVPVTDKSEVTKPASPRSHCSCNCMSQGDAIAPLVSSMEKAAADTQRVLSEMKSEIASLNEYIAVALPGIVAAKRPWHSPQYRLKRLLLCSKTKLYEQLE